MNGLDDEIRALSARLQSDLLVLQGRLPGPAPRFRAPLLIPLGVLAGAALFVALNPPARRRAVLGLAVRASVGIFNLLATPAPH